MFLLGLILALAAVSVNVNSRVAHSPMPVLGEVGDFILTNQNSTVMTLGDLRGRVWVADIIFTRCPGPCLRMTRQMQELQRELAPTSRAMLVSLTTDPDFDTPTVLNRYADQFGADTGWIFLTGEKAQIGKLAIGSLKLSAVERKPEEQASPNDLFVHSTIFVVVDKQSRLRGVFETGGEGVDWPAEKRKLVDAVKQLEQEEP